MHKPVMSIVDTESDKLRQHYEIEEKTLEQLSIIEKELRQFDTEMKNELKQQQNWIIRLETLSEKYITVTKSDVCFDQTGINPYATSDCILHEMAEKIKSLKTSNCKLVFDLKMLRKTCLRFDELCNQLDMSVSSPFIKGDAFHKPVTFFIEFISDALKYYNAWIMRLKYKAYVLEPSNLVTIKNYKEAIQLSEDFEEYLNVGLTYCKCLKRKHKNDYS